MQSVPNASEIRRWLQWRDVDPGGGWPRLRRRLISRPIPPNVAGWLLLRRRQGGEERVRLHHLVLQRDEILLKIVEPLCEQIEQHRELRQLLGPCRRAVYGIVHRPSVLPLDRIPVTRGVRRQLPFPCPKSDLWSPLSK